MNFPLNEKSSQKLNDAAISLPLVSILIYSYAGSELERCLISIFEQKKINNFEVIICDDASDDGAWDIAQRYALIHNGLITVSKSHIKHGKHAAKKKGLTLCNGTYCVLLSSYDKLNPNYIYSALRALEVDEFAMNSQVLRLKANNPFMPYYNPVKRELKPNDGRDPLVRICIYNFNYGRYLRQCFDSALEQSYTNIEISFSDNASTDDSWGIALEYAEKYPTKISLTRNRVNYGPGSNLKNCYADMSAKYVLKLCSDDAIHPEFIERCVAAMELNPAAAFTMVHRDIMDENGNCTQEPAFYEKSCVISGDEQAAVYMMSSINPSVSQILYSVDKSELKRMVGNLSDRWFGDRIMDFHLCCDFPVIYIKDPLLLNRVHGESDGSQMDSNLLQCLGEYVLVHQFADIAASNPSMTKAVSRLPTALEKLGGLCLRYSLRRLSCEDEIGAKRYFHLAMAMFPDVSEHEMYIELSNYWLMNVSERKVKLSHMLEVSGAMKRMNSYPIPPNSLPLSDRSELNN